MAFGIYKQGQGYWTRMMTFLGGLIMFAWGGAWLKGQVEAFRFEQVEGKADPAVVYGWVALISVVVIGAALSYWIAYSKPRTSEFFIATEGEMKKVNWSNRREVMGSTWVVIGVSVFMAVGIFLVDLGFSNFFKAINVLQSGS